MPITNGVHTHGKPLNVLIVGAGIGGLTAGLALRQAGHSVTIIESSKFGNEAGAAIHIAPNCNGLLRRLGVILEDVGANPLESLEIQTHKGGRIAFIDYSKDRRWQHPWLLVHRAHIHNALKEKAVSKDEAGEPCILRLASKVSKVDPQTPSITLESGETISADLVLGADGVHSQCRKALEGGLGYSPYDSGHSAFRFMVPVQEILDDPDTKEFAAGTGKMMIITDNEDKRLIMYPCVWNTLMNCVFIHPSSESRSKGQDWNQPGDKKRMLEIGESFAAKFRSILEKAQADTIKIWTLLDLPVLPTWLKGNLALIGDAAHPFLPHQAQGAAQAIEDAVSIATLLPLGTMKSDIPDRLDMYMECRQARADKIQAMTRLSGKSYAEQTKVGYSFFSFTTYNFSHDAYDHATNMLNRHLWAKSSYRYRQPISFGPAPGPGQPQNRLSSACFPTRHHLVRQTIRFATSKSYLESLLPTPAFSFRAPDTVVQASFVCCSLKNVSWLGGTGYNRCGLYIHGLQYTKQDGEMIHGTFLPIQFENLVDPIIAGREDLGAPRWGCDIEIFNTGEDGGISIKMAWRGTQFGEVHLNGLSDASEDRNQRPVPSPDHGILTYRYIPAVGEPGKADAQYAVFDPYPKKAASDGNPAPSNAPNGSGLSLDSSNAEELHEPEVITKIAKNPWVNFTPGDWHSLPTIHHIAKFLSEIPIYDIIEAKIEEISSVCDVSQARRIE